MKTPAEVIASLAGTDRECVSQRLAAIRECLATPEGRAYVANLSEQPVQPLWADDFFQSANASAEPVAS